ncbi:MAG TPA: hypothetical protein VK308_01790, partial [Pyrinomonadaceae bacterium]|nr:hypothetical protein [Pyrinomonadaceae bacterium]
MKFRDKELTPGEYQYHFLLFIDELAPEVLETLKKLVPKYKEVFGAFEYDHRNYLFGCLIANKTDKGNYILFKLDSSVLSNNPNAPEPSVNEDPI